MKKIIFTLFFIILTIIKYAYANENQGQALTENEIEFFEKLKKAITDNDKNWIAENLNYPLKINVKDYDKIIKSEAEFSSIYNNVFNCNVRFAITQQSIKTLFKNWSGVMIGSGEVWFIETINESGDVKLYITAIQKVKQYGECN